VLYINATGIGEMLPKYLFQNFKNESSLGRFSHLWDFWGIDCEGVTFIEMALDE
jgi:hypothetical protein